MSDTFFANRTAAELQEYCDALECALQHHEVEHPDCEKILRGWDVWRRVRCEIHLRTPQ